ncbi:Glycoprotein-N-acetylgalactosamine 3-beta-galactosyltransferase 1, partial [Stegodyphus mimosarum]
MLIPGSISVFSSYWRTSAFLTEEGMNCCSDKAITFHGLLPSKMYLMEYILYHLAVFKNSLQGIGNNPPQREDNSVLNEIPKFPKRKQVGEPFVQLLDKNWSRSNKKRGAKSEKTIVQNIWDEIFGS